MCELIAVARTGEPTRPGVEGVVVKDNSQDREMEDKRITSARERPPGI